MARRLAVHAQGLDGAWELPEGKEGAARTVERLGYVQIDTIAVVRRAHHHTLWVRTPGYHPDMLHELQASDRRVFEYWAHAAAYLPMRDYRFSLPRMGWESGPDGRAREWLNANRKVAEHVLSRIRAEGALAAADFEDTRSRKRRSWWDWKPAKRALESLFSTGELMVTERRNFQRIYDLTERVLPAGVDTRMPSHEEATRFRIGKLLRSMGLVSRGRMHWSVRNDDPASRDALQALVDEGEAVRVSVPGFSDEELFAHAPGLEAVRGRRANRKRVRLLSPFDNLTISRHWLGRLFDFDYKLECYTPAAKRRWGYFCLPVLWGDRFVARIDPKAARKTGVLKVRGTTFEPELKAADALLPPLARELWRLAAFNECGEVAVEDVAPRKLRIPLARAVAAAG
jgi:uncharacterized protein YcaQ